MVAQAELIASLDALHSALATEAVLDVVVKLAERYARAVTATPGVLPPEGTYTDPSHIFAALRSTGVRTNLIRILNKCGIGTRGIYWTFRSWDFAQYII